MRVSFTSTIACTFLCGALLAGCGSGGGGGSRATSVAPTQSQTTTTPVTTLALSSLTPVVGSDQGNVEVTLTGTGFEPGLQVHFGTTPAMSVVVVSSQTVLCRTPAHAPGIVDVAVVTSAGRSILAQSFEYQLSRIQRQGELDMTFANQGFVTQDEGNGSSSFDLFFAVTTDTQGRVLAVGEAGTGIARDLVLYRFLEDGTPDSSFGNQGMVRHTDAAGGTQGWDKGEAIAVDSLGRIVVAGRSYNANRNADMAVWRFLDNGMLDLSFNGQGFFTHDGAAGGTGWDNGQALAIDSVGRIVIGGYSSAMLNGSIVSTRQATVWRMLENGSLDTSFGTNGFTVMTSTTSDEAFGLALDAQERIVIAGEIDGGTNQDMALWRLTATGTLDPTYGLNGRATHHDAAGGGGADAGLALSLDGQDRAVVAGRSVVMGGGTAMVVWRFDADGTLDTTFNGQGYALLDDPGGTTGATDIAYGVAVEPVSGSIVVVGNGTGTNFSDATIWQLDQDGTTDTAFGTQGVFQHDNAAGGSRTDQARSVTFDARGRILVAGGSWGANNDNDFAIWRLR